MTDIMRSRLWSIVTYLLCSSLLDHARAGENSAVDFVRDVQPIFQASCLKCHSRGKYQGGLSLESRTSLFAGGESGAAVVAGNSGASLLAVRISSDNPDLVMPQSGDRLSPEQITLLRAWIDQGAQWPEEISFGFPTAPLEPRRPELPPPTADQQVDNPIDRILAPYLSAHEVPTQELVSDRMFARRIYLDLVGLLPTPEQLVAFEQDIQLDKRARLVDAVLNDRRAYAEHWLTFWNDALRNDYRGTGFIDNGRTAITGWLYRALYENKPYNQFVHELVSPVAGSEGFTKGIVWRGVVNASQNPSMQAAQSISQVFLGVNLKCASCHDSFVSYLKLDSAYALANVFADQPLEIHRCDKPTGKQSPFAFIYPQLGPINATSTKHERMQQLADLMVKPENGRLARTIVNRLWAQLFGRGIVEPVDNMDQTPWNTDLLDWLAVDLADHGFDLKHTLKVICLSRAYQLPAVGTPQPSANTYTFGGPQTKRMSAEQYIDAVSSVIGTRPTVAPEMLKVDARGQGGQIAAVAEVDGERNDVRAALMFDDPLNRALGRPNREQVVTRRESAATMLQVLELTNGTTLDGMLDRGAERWLERHRADRKMLVEQLYLAALGRVPRAEETAACYELVVEPPTKEGVKDLLWAICMLPEFQLIH
jgi:hypothetical protein